MQKILFPTDFSPIANNAFVYALTMAQQLGSEIIALHVYDSSSATGKAYDEIELEAFDNFKDSIPMLRRIADDYDMEQVSVKHMLEKGDVVDQIIKVAERDRFDLVVMGTKGASGLKEVFMGTKTAEVINRLSTPVLSIPDEATFDGNINDIVFTTDYDEEDRGALRQATNFARAFGAEIHCLHFDTSHTESLTNNMEKWKASLRDLNYDKIRFQSIDTTNMEKELNGYISREGVDVIVMQKERKSVMSRLFDYSFSNQSVNHLHTPTLAM
jgi:nucleotide-binding universal stress UspA family protein